MSLETTNMTTNKSIAQVKALLDPASIAIVGASDRNGSWAKRVFRVLKRGGYKGAIYPVNPRVGLTLGSYSGDRARRRPRRSRGRVARRDGAFAMR